MKVVRFGIVGAANTITDYSVYWLLLTLGTMPRKVPKRLTSGNIDWLGFA